MRPNSVVTRAHELLAASLAPGDIAIDATVGNGHDTLHLANCVWPTGLVIGFDIQSAAIESTRSRLEDAGRMAAVVLCQTGHENMADEVTTKLADSSRELDGGVGGICFNLGYLPGGNKSIVTIPATTLKALDASLELLRLGGVLTATLYSGHSGGKAERDAVLGWVEGLVGSIPDNGTWSRSEGAFEGMHFRVPDKPTAPELIALRSRSTPT